MRILNSTFTTILILTTFLSCNRIDKKDGYKFQMPVIIQKYNLDTVTQFSEESVNGFDPRVLNKYKFSDTIRIPDESIKQKEYGRSESHYYHYLVGRTDSTLTDGLEIVTDYSKDIGWYPYGQGTMNKFYLVYIINQTPNIKGFLGKDGIAFGLQEALDTLGNWRPIEGRGWDFCGCCLWGLKIEPQEFLAVLFPKYSGNYKTKIRVRIKNGDNIYVSKPFDATINEKQLYLKKDRGFYKELIEHRSDVIQNKFYGAVPFGMDYQSFDQYEHWEK
jgi:hypothetical protein